MNPLIKLLLSITLLFSSAITYAEEINLDHLYGVWNIDKMVMRNGSSFPGTGDKLEFTKEGMLKTIMGSSTISNDFRLERASVFVKVPIGEAEHRINSLSSKKMLFQLPDGMVYELSKP